MVRVRPAQSAHHPILLQEVMVCFNKVVNGEVVLPIV